MCCNLHWIRCVTLLKREPFLALLLFFSTVVSTQFVGLKQSMLHKKSNAVTCALEDTQCMELSPPHPSY